MAIGSDGIYIVYKLLDKAGNQSSVRLQTNPATITDYATASAAAVANLTLLAAVTDCTVIGYDVQFRNAEQGTLVAGNELKSVVGLFSVRDSDNAFKAHTVRVPGVRDALVIANTNTIDKTSTAVQDWLNRFATGGDFLISDGENIATITPNGEQINAARRVTVGFTPRT